MSIKSILVHVIRNESSAVIEAATTIAEKFDAHISGVGIEPIVTLPSYATAELPSGLIRSYETMRTDHLKEAEASFTSGMNKVGRIARSSWRGSSHVVANVITEQAKYCDLVILGQTRTENVDFHNEKIPDDVIVGANGGVLVVPYIGFMKTIGDSILIAWNNTNESALAVRTALPLLKLASKVEVLTVSNENEDEFSGMNISAYLAEHGIDVTLTKSAANKIDVASVILNVASDREHDLIVMGGYSHMRLREIILGGVTRRILKNMTVPVLFAH